MIKYVLCSDKISVKIRERLKESGLTPVLLPPYERLPEPVASHPDMLVYRLRSGALLTYAGYYALNSSVFQKLGCVIITEKIVPEKEYPKDIVLNALRVGDIVFGRTDRLSEMILKDTRRSVFIRQGYSRCSACVIDDGSLITADPAVASAVAEYGVSVTFITGGGIRLEGYGCGFIGGASGVIGNSVAFFGNISAHPEGEKIKAAVLSRGKDIISLEDDVLTDYGGLMII